MLDSGPEVRVGEPGLGSSCSSSKGHRPSRAAELRGTGASRGARAPTRTEVERTGSSRSEAIWDKTARWNTRAEAEQEGAGCDESLVTATLALCAIDAVVSQRVAGDFREESFRRRVGRLQGIDADDRRFLYKAWDVRNGLVHHGQTPPADFDSGRLWAIASRLSPVPLVTSRLASSDFRSLLPRGRNWTINSTR